MKFPELAAQASGAQIDPRLIEAQNEGSPYPPISPYADFDPSVKIGRVEKIGDDVTVGQATKLADGVSIEGMVHVGEKVTIAHGARIGRESVLMARAHVGELAVVNWRSIIGPGVNLPAESQIGDNMIIPTTKTIVAIGRFGSSERMVTIHGDFDGPRYSIGCQDSVEWRKIKDRILTSTETVPHSARHYEQYLDVFNLIGNQVQREFDKESTLIEEIQGQVEEITASNPY